MTKDRRTKDEFDLRKVLTGRGPGQSRLKLAPEHVIYAQGDAADALFYVESGWVKMSAVVPSGKEPAIALRRGGRILRRPQYGRGTPPGDGHGVDRLLARARDQIGSQSLAS